MLNVSTLSVSVSVIWRTSVNPVSSNHPLSYPPLWQSNDNQMDADLDTTGFRCAKFVVLCVIVHVVRFIVETRPH